jgi:hypothetical protein
VVNAESLFAALESGRLEEAKWHAQAILHLKGISKVQSSKHSIKTSIPLSACDLPTLLDTLLAIQTSTDPLLDDTSSARLKSLAKSLRNSSTSDSSTGPVADPPSRGSRPSIKRLHSNRKYWPQSAKTVFWDVVRNLNQYDKELAKGGKKSPIQLLVAEEITRRHWEDENGYACCVR